MDVCVSSTRLASVHIGLAVISLLCASLNTIQASEESCPRKENVVGRHCLKRCTKHADCVSARKRCMCDGDCGKSCINPNSRCKGLESSVANGRVEIFPYNQFGALSRYVCDDGYVLYGMPARVCQGDETWSGKSPRCVLDTNIEQSECGSPPVVHNAHNNAGDVTSFPLGTNLRYACNEGFTSPHGTINTAWCVGGSGVWVGPNMTCGHAGCPLLSPIDFGTVEIIPPNMIGSKSRYSCLPGYHLAGRAERTCMSDGTWDGKEPSCERVTCGLPPEVDHSSQDSPRGQTSYPSGTQLEYSCEFGFYREGYPKAMCSDNGKWIGPRMTCSPRSCGFPGDVHNGWREGFRFSYPSSVAYNCNEGYDLHGRPSRKCQPNGEWSGTLPSCNPVTCPVLEPPERGTMIGAGFTYGAMLEFRCEQGYRVIGSAERRCQADGSWNGNNAICQEINCGMPAPLWNGYLDGHKTTVGSVFFFRCNVRATFDGDSFTTHCQENGHWSNKPPKCWGQCQVPSVLNGTLTEGREGVWVNHRDVIHYRCRSGLVLNDSTEIRCNNGTWTVIPQCIPSPCQSPPPAIKHGRRIFFGHAHGDKTRYSCLVGFRLNGDRYRQCHFGKWIGQKPKCEEIYCPNPGTLKHGKIYKRGKWGKFDFMPYIVTIKHGDRLDYECDRDYKIRGPAGAMCVNGSWRPQEKPTCIPAKHKVFHTQCLLFKPFSHMTFGCP